MKVLVFITVCLIFLVAVEAKAMCVTSLVKTGQLKGIAADPRGNPFPKIRIELKRRDNPDFVIKSVETDDEGRFDLGETDSGRYIIYASNEFVPSFAFEVKHKKVKRLKNEEPQLRIVVGITFSGGCKGWSASYGNQRT